MEVAHLGILLTVQVVPVRNGATNTGCVLALNSWWADSLHFVQVYLYTSEFLKLFSY